MPISVFIIAKNEADVIGKAIASVSGWVDEIILIDSGSEDDTVAIAESMGARTMFRAWEGYGPQKIFGEAQCRNDWILNIDADEEVSPELAKEIQELFAQGNPTYAAFRQHWKLLVGQETKPRRFATGSSFIRLYDRSRAGYRNSTVHDSVVVREGEIGTLHQHIWHRNYRNYAHWQKKMAHYSELQSEDLFAKNRCPSTTRLIVEPIIAFFKCYILRRYFLYGLDGYLVSWLYVHAKLARLMRTRDLFFLRKAPHTIKTGDQPIQKL